VRRQLTLIAGSEDPAYNAAVGRTFRSAKSH